MPLTKYALDFLSPAVSRNLKEKRTSAYYNPTVLMINK
jgi:hypothetical protein